MNKELALETMMLLSALESWAFSKSDRTLPDHLLEDINNVQEQLKAIVLAPQWDSGTVYGPLNLRSGG